jgi:4-amino-4-deoxy-L-arabinose transferase-like glycosyltransferase
MRFSTKATVTTIALVLISLVALGLRTWNLSDIPGGLTWDEAALGYNAYSLLETGRDEHGVSWPLVFKSFGDYKPGAYVYWAMPFIALLDLSEFSTRLPSAVAGVLAVFGIYLLAKQMFKSRRTAVFAAGVLAVSPWHLFYSRGAWEVNLFVTLLIFSVYFWLRVWEEDFPMWPALILASITLYTYQAAKMLTVLVLGLVVIAYWPRVWKQIKQTTWWKAKALTLIIVGLIFAFTAWQNLSAEAGNRLTRLSIFNYQPGIAQEDIDIDGERIAAIFHSQPEQTIRSIASRYTYHFAPEVLFFEGEVVTDRGHIPRLGMMYMLEAVLLVIGLAAAYKSHKFLLGLLLIAPIPASLTLAEFSTTRAMFLVVPLVLLVALGLEQIARSRRQWVTAAVALLYLANIIYGLDIYFSHSQKAWAFEFNYGHKEAVEIIQRYPDSPVVFTDVYGQPYIYYLFYTKYPPAQYQAQNRFEDGGVDVGHVSRVDSVEFRQFSLQDIRLSTNTVFVGSPTNIAEEFLNQIENLEYYQQIDREAHKPIFRVVKTE